MKKLLALVFVSILQASTPQSGIPQQETKSWQDVTDNQIKKQLELLQKILNTQINGQSKTKMSLVAKSGSLQNYLQAIYAAQINIAKSNINIAKWNALKNTPQAIVAMIPKTDVCSKLANPIGCYVHRKMNANIAMAQKNKQSLDWALVQGMGGIHQMIVATTFMKSAEDVNNLLEVLPNAIDYYKVQYDKLINTCKDIDKYWQQEYEQWIENTIVKAKIPFRMGAGQRTGY
ncbi:hypothetical protein [Helicobacter suis]|uniref:hypothetical protein n=1 Tax=Helicobacter suis TaxID=104628 RepID=UPI000CF07A03|nr:hypothetical protein [Helicobacter suis]